MGQAMCKVATKQVRDLASKLNISIPVATVKISSWQKAHNKSMEEIPTVTELREVLTQTAAQSIDEAIQGEEISSRGSELGKKLTNIGNDISVKIQDKTYRNAEHAYQTWKSGEFDEVAYNSTEYKPKGSKKVDTAKSQGIMERILTLKLEQHPELVEEITSKGGEKFLEKSTHKVTNRQDYWETDGQNGFIKALIAAYKKVAYGTLETDTSEDVLASADKIEYTPTGKARQTYYIKGGKIYNKEGKEVFKRDSVDKNRIFANYAVAQGRAVVVTYKKNSYVVNKKGQIISVATGKIMQWDENNGDRKAIIEEAHKQFNSKTTETTQSTSEQKQVLDTTTQLVTVAPYFREKLTSTNKEELEKATQRLHDAAKALAAILNVTIDKVVVQGGTYLGSSEISYGYRLKNATPEQADLFGMLLGDLGFEYQDATIASNYTEDETKITAYEIVYKVPQNTTIEDIEAFLKEHNIEGSTFNFESGELSILAFSEEETRNVIDNLNDSEYEYKGHQGQDSRYMDNEYRRNAYQTWLKAHSTEQEGRLYNACAKALAIAEAASKYSDASQEKERLEAANKAAKEWDEAHKPKPQQQPQTQQTQQTQPPPVQVVDNSLKGATVYTLGNSKYYIKDQKLYDSTGTEITDENHKRKVFANIGVAKGTAVVINVRMKTGPDSQVVVTGQGQVIYKNGELMDYTDPKTVLDAKTLITIGLRELRKQREKKEEEELEKYTNAIQAAPDFESVSVDRSNYFNVFSMAKRADRSKLIARLFSKILDNECKKLENQLLTRTQVLAQDGKIYSIFEGIRKFLIQSANNPNYTDYQRQQYAMMVDSKYFIYLCEEACNRLRKDENIEVSISNNPEEISINEVGATEVIDDEGNVSAPYQASSEEADHVMEGWQVNFREVNPSLSLTTEVRKLIGNIKKVKKDGTVEKDDIGCDRYLDSKYVSSVLGQLLNTMLYSKDMLPLLEKAVKTKPWLAPLLNELNNNPSLASQFYSCYRKDTMKYYIQYETIDSNGNKKVETKQVNSPDGLAPYINKWNYTINSGERITIEENGEEITPIYNSIGKPVVYKDAEGKYHSKVAEQGQEIVKKLKEKLDEVADKSDSNVLLNTLIKDKDFATKLQTVLAMVGIDITSEELEDSLMINKDDKTPLARKNVYEVLNGLTRIFNGVATNYGEVLKRTGSEDNSYNIGQDFSGVYQVLARCLNTTDANAIENSCHENGKDYYSLTNPNYMGKIIATLSNKQGLSNQEYKALIEQEFGQYEWFKKDGEWLCTWIDELVNNPKSRTILEHKVLLNKDKVEYPDLSSLEYTKALLNEYFSTLDSGSTKTAWYHVPILSDAPSAEFIKFERFDNLNTVIEKLSSLVLQEYNRIQLVKERAQSIAERTTEPITSFDISYNKDGSVKSKGGSEFKFIPSLNDYTINGRSFLDVLESMHGTPNNGAAIKKFIEGALKEVMEKDFQETVKEWRTLGLFSTTEVSKGQETVKQYDNLVGMTYSEGDKVALDRLKNYYYNSCLATSQIIELTTTDLAFYKNMEDFQKRYKEVHAPSQRLDTTFAKYARQIEKTIYIKDSVKSSDIKEAASKIFQKAVNDGTMQQDTYDYLVSQLDQVNEADSMAYRSLSSYRAIQDMVGQWSEESQASFEKLMDPNATFGIEDFNVIYQQLKPFLYTQTGVDSKTSHGKIKTPVQHKNSEFLLLFATKAAGKTYAKAQKLKAIETFMEKAGIDVVQFESTTKVGLQGAIDLSDIADDDFQGTIDKLSEMTGIIIESGVLTQGEQEAKSKGAKATIYEKAGTSASLAKALRDAKITERSEVVHQVSYEDYGIQMGTPEHIIDHEQLFGSQLRKLIIMDLPNSTDPNYRPYNVAGKAMNKQELIRFYNEVMTENVLQSYLQVKDLFVNSDGTPNIEKLSKELIDIVKNDPNYGPEYVRAFTLVTDENGNKRFNIPLFDPIISAKTENLLTALFKNRITKQKIKGGSCFQVSCYGMSDSLHIVTEDGKSVQEGGRVKYVECKLPAYSKKFYESLIDENGILDVSKLDEDLLKVVGYRIPTENKYSMVPLKIVGFLPQQNGSSIMLPREITYLSGSDKLDV